MDREEIGKTAWTAFEAGVNPWILRSRVSGGRIQEPDVELTPGCLIRDVDVEAEVSREAAGSRMPAPVPRILGVLGKGPVPSFAPPDAPVRPVVSGDNIAGPGHVVASIAGPRFGARGR